MLKTLSILAFVAIAFTGQAQVAPAIEWQRSLGSTTDDHAHSIRQTSDGGYIVAGDAGGNNGDVSGFHGGLADAWVVKLDGNGVLQWQRPLGGPGGESGQSVQQTNDGGYIMAGSSNSNGGDVTGNHGADDAWVVKLDATGTLQWQRSLGGSAADYAYSIQQTNEGGYILAGGSRSTDGDATGNHGSTDCWVVKLDMGGDLQWQQSLGGTGYEDAYSIQQTSDGGYVMAGQTSSSDGDISGYHGGIDCWAVKLDGSGNLQWQKALGGSSEEEAFSIEQTEDGGYVMAGSTHSSDGDVSDGQAFDEAQWIVKLDGNGGIQWQKVLGGSDQDYARDVHELGGGGYIVAGWTQSEDGQVSGYHGGQFGDAWVVRLNATGDLLWQKALGGSGTDRAFAIQQSNDGGYILAGWSDSTDGDVTGNHGDKDAWVVKLGPDDVGIAELENAVSFSLFPNPSTEAVSIQLDLAASAPVRLQLYDATGQLVGIPVDAQVPAGERTFRYSTGGLPTGIYELRLNAGGRTFTRKLVKL
jgi:hypothetical protein